MSWTTVAVIGIAAFVVVAVVWLVVAAVTARRALDSWRKEGEEFDRRWEERRGRRP